MPCLASAAASSVSSSPSFFVGEVFAVTGGFPPPLPPFHTRHAQCPLQPLTSATGPAWDLHLLLVPPALWFSHRRRRVFPPRRHNPPHISTLLLPPLGLAPSGFCRSLPVWPVPSSRMLPFHVFVFLSCFRFSCFPFCFFSLFVFSCFFVSSLARVFFFLALLPRLPFDRGSVVRVSLFFVQLHSSSF